MTCIFDPRSSHAFSPLDTIEYHSFLFIIAAKQVLTYEIEQEVLFRGTQRICCSLYLFPIGILLAGKILGVPMIWLGNFLLLEHFKSSSLRNSEDWGQLKKRIPSLSPRVATNIWRLAREIAFAEKTSFVPVLSGYFCEGFQSARMFPQIEELSSFACKINSHCNFICMLKFLWCSSTLNWNESSESNSSNLYFHSQISVSAPCSVWR